MTQAAAATNREQSANAPRTAKQKRVATSLEARLAKKIDAARKHRGTIRFFETHRQLFGSAEHGTRARTAARRAERRLAAAMRDITAIRRTLRKREARRRAAMPPKAAICDVFGRYCDQAVAVAWCESRLDTTARNGQYLGLFQMGSYERRLFGHGRNAREQAAAAHRYFVRSGRDWSPWGCRWAAY